MSIRELHTAKLAALQAKNAEHTINLQKACLRINQLEAGIKEQSQIIAAIKTGIRNEFTIGESSGDVLQDFGMFIDHHNKVERELKDSQRETQEWKTILERRDKHIVDQNTEIVSLKIKQDELKKPFKAQSRPH